MNVYKDYPRFATLFQGLEGAFGTGAGRWVKRPLRPEDWCNHLQGRGAGIGVAPLRPDNTVMFAAIDLDEPDFDAAREMMGYLPGVSWLESSRSGNAHVWVFFREPLEAWVAMGVMKEATLAAGKTGVEVFPKNHDFERVRLGNYINLPFHGNARPILGSSLDVDAPAPTLEQFVTEANDLRNDPTLWRKRARLLMIDAPGERGERAEFGSQTILHRCADHVISGEAGPITEGHRNAVFFMLAKCLTNWKDCDHDEALMILRSVNDDLCNPPESDAEIRRILGNVERAQYTSTGCDDPLVLPFAHPDCPIANPRS
jgi:hypothetical protein